MAGDAGAFSLSGQAASLLAQRLINAAVGTYTLTGQAAGLSVVSTPSTIPGVEYTASGACPHYQALGSKRPHYTASGGRPHYEAVEE